MVWLGVSKSTTGHRYLFRVLLHFSHNSAGWGCVLPLQLATLQESDSTCFQSNLWVRWYNVPNGMPPYVDWFSLWPAYSHRVFHNPRRILPGKLVIFAAICSIFRLRLLTQRTMLVSGSNSGIINVSSPWATARIILFSTYIFLHNLSLVFGWLAGSWMVCWWLQVSASNDNRENDGCI